MTLSAEGDESDRSREGASAELEMHFLRLLVDKHNEQSGLFYRRMQVFLIATGFLIAASVSLVTEPGMRPGPRWISTLVVATIGCEMSRQFAGVLTSSNNWIMYWESKIIHFESTSRLPGIGLTYFSDRLNLTPAAIEARGDELHPERVEKYNRWLFRIGPEAEKRGESLNSVKLGELFSDICSLMGASWAVLAVWSLCAGIHGFDVRSP